MVNKNIKVTKRDKWMLSFYDENKIMPTDEEVRIWNYAFDSGYKSRDEITYARINRILNSSRREYRKMEKIKKMCVEGMGEANHEI